jgi:hypothetical protein
MTQVIKHAPPVIMKNPTISTWLRKRRAITISLTTSLLIARRSLPRTYKCVFFVKDGKRFTNCVILGSTVHFLNMIILIQRLE